MTNTKQPKAVSFEEYRAAHPERFTTSTEAIEAIRINKQTQTTKQGSIVLATLLGAVLVSCIALAFAYPKEAPITTQPLTPAQTQAQVEHNAKHDVLVARLAELNQIEDKINCPSFFDAPLGNKPCPAHELVESGKAIIQEQLNAE
jgi:hypothetical protein